MTIDSQSSRTSPERPSPDRMFTDRLVAQFATLGPSLPGAGLGWLAHARAAALNGFAETGLPTQKVEAWKYTNLNPLLRLALVPAVPATRAIDAALLPWLLPKSESHRLVFVNGRFDAKLSVLGKLPKGAELVSLASALATGPGLLEGKLGASIQDASAQDASAKHASAKDLGALASLNTALMADGFVLRIADGVELEHAIELMFVASPGTEPIAYYPRGLVQMGKASRATLVEQHVALGSGGYFADLVTEIDLAQGAALDHYKHQAEGPEAIHIATHRVTVGQGARYSSFVLAGGGRLARTEIGVELAAPGASCRLDGAYYGRGRQLIDNTSVIDHLHPDTTSREVYKGVLDGSARGVFQGRIHVHPGADRTDGQQTCRTLLLSDGAEIDAKPELEIYADDVKCSHGAAVGEIADDALFYLRSRGIPESQARHMLVEAFLGEAIEAIENEGVRDGFRTIVQGWLASAATAQAAE
jgi:Fe-S cluster assembly protein SufD